MAPASLPCAGCMWYYVVAKNTANKEISVESQTLRYRDDGSIELYVTEVNDPKEGEVQVSGGALRYLLLGCCNRQARLGDDPPWRRLDMKGSGMCPRSGQG